MQLVPSLDVELESSESSWVTQARPARNSRGSPAFPGNLFGSRPGVPRRFPHHLKPGLGRFRVDELGPVGHKGDAGVQELSAFEAEPSCRGYVFGPDLDRLTQLVAKPAAYLLVIRQVLERGRDFPHLHRRQRVAKLPFGLQDPLTLAVSVWSFWYAFSSDASSTVKCASHTTRSDSTTRRADPTTSMNWPLSGESPFAPESPLRP